MRIPRFFPTGVDQKALGALRQNNHDISSQVTLSEDDLIKQIRSVLRLGVGNKLQLLDSEGAILEVKIEQMTKSQIFCSLISVEQAPAKTSPRIHVAMSLIKPDRFEWCLEKLCELGVDSVQPVITQHTVNKTMTDFYDAKGTPSQKLLTKIKRWTSIVREAAEQCERRTIPDIVNPISLANYLTCSASGGTNDLRYICAERKKAPSLHNQLGSDISKRDPSDITTVANISILIGPEGGFSSEEFALADERGWQFVTLGSRILRSETAALLAMSQVALLLESEQI